MQNTLQGAILLLKGLPESDELKSLISKMEQKQETLFNDVCKLLKVNKETDVLNHGDCWMNNILFKSKKDEIHVKFVDLQIMRYMSVAADLSYFFYINLYPKLRIEKMSYLLDFYLNCLHSTLYRHQLFHEIEVLDKNWLQDEMKRFSVFGFSFGLWIMPIFYIKKGNIPDMESMKPEDFDSVEKNQELVQEAGEEYKSALLEFLTSYFKEYN